MQIIFCVTGTYSYAYGTPVCNNCLYPYTSGVGTKGSSIPLKACFRISIALPTIVPAIILPIVGTFLLSLFVSLGYQSMKDGGQFDWRLPLAYLLYVAIPVMDYLTDFAYVLTTVYYDVGLFIMSVLVFSMPSLVFSYSVLWRKGVVAKFWILAMPTSLFYDQYDALYKLLYTGLMSIPYVVVNAVFLLPWILFGFFLYGTKVMAIGSVQRLWFRIWTGSEEHATKDMLDVHMMNETICVHILYTTFAHLIIQAVNNSLVANWTSLDYICIMTSGLNAVDGLYKIAYYKIYLGMRIVDIPVSVSFLGWTLYDFDKEHRPDWKPGSAGSGDSSRTDASEIRHTTGLEMHAVSINSESPLHAATNISRAELEQLRQRLTATEQRLLDHQQETTRLLAEAKLEAKEETIRLLAEAKEETSRLAQAAAKVEVDKILSPKSDDK